VKPPTTFDPPAAVPAALTADGSLAQAASARPAALAAPGIERVPPDLRSALSWMRSAHWGYWAAFAAFWLAAGLLQGLAELQHYLARGGRHAWEPLLWELSSASSWAVLTLGILAWHRHLFERPRPWPLRVLGHAALALLCMLAHSALMYGLRAAAYAATGVPYEPGSTLSILAYEGAKDLVSYVLIVAVCHGVLLFTRERRQRAAWAAMQAELASARLARLQEQIQPHFLFNALNLISSVMYEDVERADRLLAELSDLLRRSLEAGREPLHRLRDELQLVQPYLSIMRQRFEDRLAVDLRVDDDTLDCLLPSLLLMAPLENAVKHGVAQVDRPVLIRLRARLRQGQLEIEVADDGAGPDSSPGATSPISLATVAASFERQESPAGSGIGLANTRGRLAAMYGAAAQVNLQREGDATVLRLRLPVQHAARAAAA